MYPVTWFSLLLWVENKGCVGLNSFFEISALELSLSPGSIQSRAGRYLKTSNKQWMLMSMYVLRPD